METCKCSIVIMSHLSDVQTSMNWESDPERAELNNTRINFAKWLILRYPDTSVEIDPDAEFELFKNRK